MDYDGQDEPADIKAFYDVITDDVDMIIGRKEKRMDAFLNRVTSVLYYKILKFITGISHDTRVSSFGLYSRKLIDAILSYREGFRSFGLFVHLVGFEKKYVEVSHGKRYRGNSSYSFFSRVDLAINSIVAHSDKPLKFSILLGLMATILAIFYAAYLVAVFFAYDIAMSGFTTIIVSMLLLFGLQFILLGVVGLYVGRAFNETKRRPLYHIKDVRNFVE